MTLVQQWKSYVRLLSVAPPHGCPGHGASRRPGHDTAFVARMIISPANICSANASLSRGFDFGPRGGPVSLFSFFPSKRGEWSAGRRPGACEAPLGRPCDRPACASCEDARALGEGPCASRRSIADRIVGGRTLLRHPTSRSTTPSVEQGMGDIDQDARTAKFNSRVCKVLQHCTGKTAGCPAFAGHDGRGAKPHQHTPPSSPVLTRSLPASW
jgi:hypothetical protein